ncbi:MAG: TfoX/Sxy family protein [bacterium]|nr:TfoX/Sxy family protein [Candidatus Kapabacteria bacterium]
MTEMLNQSYVDYILEQLERVAPVTTKKMFGAIALYGDGPIFGVIDDDTLYFKVDDSNRQQYVDADSAAFMPVGQVSQNYYQVPAHVLEDSTLLADWMRGSLAVARAAPVKRKRRGGRKTPGKPG